MGNVLLCSCNHNNGNKDTEYSIQGVYKKEDAKNYDKPLLLKSKKTNSDEFSFGKSKGGISMMAKNKNMSKEEKIQFHFFMNSLIKIQKSFRIFIFSKRKNKQTSFYNKNVKDEETSDGPTAPLYQNTQERANFNHNSGNISKFMGKKINELKEGFGVQCWKDGAQFKGIFKSNQANGLGQFLHSDGDYYSGDFLNDRASGFGIYLHGNGGRYIGMWQDDLQDGIGLEAWQDGSSYKGNYQKGKKHCIGTYSWSDGSKYEGEWENNALHGYGVYYFTDDRSYIGQWKDNMMHGYGEFSWKDGKKYIGYYSNDRKEGFGIYYWETPNKAYIGFWVNGKQDGVGKYITPTKTKYGLWKNGEKKQWFESESDAISSLTNKQIVFSKIFRYDLKEINAFLNF